MRLQVSAPSQPARAALVNSQGGGEDSTVTEDPFTLRPVPPRPKLVVFKYKAHLKCWEEVGKGWKGELNPRLHSLIVQLDGMLHISIEIISVFLVCL